MDKKSNGKAMNGFVTYGKGIAKSRVAKMGIGMAKHCTAQAGQDKEPQCGEEKGDLWRYMKDSAK